MKIPARFRDPAFLLPAVLAGLALGLRLAGAGSKSLWGDEFYAAGLMRSGFPELIRASFQGSPHPPLAFLSLRLSSLLFGTSEAALRVVPAVLTSLAAVPLFLFIRRRLGNFPAFMGGLLWVVSPYSVSLGQEVWLYGTLAFFGFTFIWLSDLAWRGSRPAAFLLVPMGLAGMLVQHIFLLFLASGFLLYFTVDIEARTSIRRFLLLALLMLLVYVPFMVPALDQAGLRSARIRSAGMEGVLSYRLVRRVPTVVARLIPGGLASEMSRWDFSRPVTPAIFIVSSACVLVPMVLLSFCRRLSLSQRLWALGTFLMPLLLFAVEDPTARHLSIMWVPLALATAALARSFRPAALAVAAFAALLLFPYYRVNTFPYHRSDWRSAVTSVIERLRNDQQVVVLAGQNGGLAWDYYAGSGTGRLAPGGADPYGAQPVTGGPDPLSTVDSTLRSGRDTWVVHDLWGGPRGREIAPGWKMVLHENHGPHLEVMLFAPERTGEM